MRIPDPAVTTPGFRSGPPVKPAAAPPPVPEPLAAQVGRAGWEHIWVKAGSDVWRATTPAQAWYLKIGPADGPDGTGAEAERLTWLADRPVGRPTDDAGSTAPNQTLTPAPVGHVVDERRTGWLLTDEVPGLPAHDPVHRMGALGPLMDGLGRGLRRFHDSLAVEGCPFDARLDVLLARSEARVVAGRVDVAALDPAYRRSTPEALLAHLRTARPGEAAEDLVVAHGDPCLPNLLVDRTTGQLGGVVDVGRLGVSDRYRDLGIAARSLVQNFGPEVAQRFFDAYGLGAPDLVRLEYYVLLDALC